MLCTDSLVARPRGTKVRREVVLTRAQGRAFTSLGRRRVFFCPGAEPIKLESGIVGRRSTRERSDGEFRPVSQGLWFGPFRRNTRARRRPTQVGALRGESSSIPSNNLKAAVTRRAAPPHAPWRAPARATARPGSGAPRRTASTPRGETTVPP